MTMVKIRVPLRMAVCLAAFAFVARVPEVRAEPASSGIGVAVDQARLVRLPDRVSTIVVGNPLIADVTLQPGGVMVVTGKGYGSTNMIAMDRGGNVLLERPIEVGGPAGDVVTVYRGIERETYSCTPQCQKRLTLGDSDNYFNGTLQQSGTLNTQAANSAEKR